MDIRDTALKYLASRPRTCGEMRKHLREKGFEEEEIEGVIRRFQTVYYLDDEDYCRQYFDYAFGKGKGFFRVKRELEEKGVDRELIQMVFEDYEEEESEFERASRQAEKLAAGQTPGKKLAGRIGRRLSALGYSRGVIYKIAGKYMREQDE